MLKKSALFLRSERGELKIREVANILKKSSQRLKYQLTTLEKDQIVHDPYCIFDYSYFGLILFRVYFKEAYISEADKARIIKQLTENNYIVAVYETTGEFDLFIEIAAQNPSKFNKVLGSIINLIPTMRHYQTLLNIVTYLYPRYYLTEREFLYSYVPPQIIVGGDREIQVFTKNELIIIKNMLDNAKIRLTSLSEKSALNIRTAKKNLKCLQEKNILKGVKYQINTDKLGINSHRIYLKLHNRNADRDNELLKFLRDTREIIQASKTVGDWDLEIDIESPDRTRIRKLIVLFREKFKDVIEKFNIMELNQSYKRTYLPKYYFENLAERGEL